MATVAQSDHIISTTDESLVPFLTAVEKDLLLHIISNMGESKLTVGEAQKLAQEFLALLPMLDKEDLLRKLNTLGQQYSPAREVYVKYGSEYEEQKRQQKLLMMREHIKNGNIEQAIAVAKGGPHV